MLAVKPVKKKTLKEILENSDISNTGMSKYLVDRQ